MIRISALAASLLALLIAAGCGSSVNDENASGGSGSGASGSGGSGSGGDTSSSSGSGGTNQCAGFDDEQGAATVTIRFRNETGQDVYLPGTCTEGDFSIDPLGGSDGNLYHFEGACLKTCEDLQTEGPIVCGACAPLVYRIPSGGSLEFAWNGTGLHPDAGMPAACFAFPERSSTCSRIVAAPAGTYRVGATGYAECQGEAAGGCQCNEDDGHCFGSATGLQALPDPVKFEFPSASVVDVVFGVCAFGCADP